MSRDRPINASEPDEAPPAAPAKPRRAPKPLAPKLLGGLVVLAIAFIAFAVIGGSGGSGGDGGETTARSAGSETEPAAAGLPFPAAATNNTTRVPGADAAALAAAVALAVFPSGEAGQRPDAVTLVGAGDWAGTVAAASLMAEPARAPLLVSTPAALPAASAAALAALRPVGGSASNGKSTFLVGDVAGATGEALRLGGEDAAARAVAVAKLRRRLTGRAPERIVIAPETAPEFAIPAAAWAARSGDPVLFAGGDDLPEPTAEFLRSHSGVPIFVLGPQSALSGEIVREAGNLGGPVTRVGDEDAVANALELATRSVEGFGWGIDDPGHGFVLARSEDPQVAALSAPLSASGTWGPLLLTDNADTLPAPLRDFFLDVKPGYTDDPTRAFYNRVWVIGDEDAIGVDQQAEVNELAELEKIGDER